MTVYSSSSSSSSSSPRFIAYYEGENNGYDDSDFFTMFLDLQEKKVVKHIHSTTRCGGHVAFKHKYVEKYDDLEIIKLAKTFSLEVLSSDYAGRINYTNEGDIVQVTNTRVRKHKGSIFKITSLRKCQFSYGDKFYCLGKDIVTGEDVKTSLDNVTLYKPLDSKIDRAINGIVFGSKV